MKGTGFGVLILTACLLSACGGDSDSSTEKGTATGTATGTDPDTGTKGDWSNQALTQQISGIALREAIVSGLVDSLINGSEQAVDGEKCSTGSYQQVANVLTFQNCTGLFEEEGAATGVVDVTNGFNVKNLIIKYPDGTSQTIDGQLMMKQAGAEITVTSTGLKVAAQELSSANKLIPVNYNMSAYQLVWNREDATNVRLQISAKLEEKGGEKGDFNIAFDNFMTPFFVKVDSEDEIVGYPYAGTLNIYNLDQSDSEISISSVNNQNAQYKGTVNGKVVWDSLTKWSELMAD